jgi:Tol biopolymer transport system component
VPRLQAFSLAHADSVKTVLSCLSRQPVTPAVGQMTFNNMKAKIIISLLLSSTLLLACTPKVATSPSVAESPIPVNSTENQPTVAAATSTTAPTSTNANAPATIPVCAKSGTLIPAPANFGIPGTIIYQKDYHGLYTVGGNPLTFSKLPVDEEQKYSTFGFSPDGNWFAFSPIEYSSTDDIIFDAAKILLFSANGERKETTLSIKDFADEPPVGFRFVGFSGYSHWINNTKIYAALYSGTKKSDGTWSFDDSAFKVLDPFAGIWREDLFKGLPDSTQWHTKGISPDLTRMLLMDVNGLTLRDLEKDIDIRHEKDLFAGFGALMFWSSDSKTVAYANLFESPKDRTVVLISRDGKEKTIMGPKLSLSGLLVENVQWSPDGNSLAMLVWEGEDKGDWVYIFDVAAEKFVSRCPIGKGNGRLPNIIWSPDNKYLAYASVDYPLIIMNVQSGEIVQLAEKANAVGWSDKFPVIWHQP